jgi:metal-sulfur cluster biosynthetic enzyme
VREAIKVVEDPEIGVSIVELGLVYDIDVSDDGTVNIAMTLTSPYCPIGPLLTSQIQTVAEEVPGVRLVNVNLVWTPPWDPKTMASEEARDMLGIW